MLQTWQQPIYQAAIHLRDTLRDEDLQKIASYMKESFNTQVAEITQASLQQSVSELVNSIVSGVLSGLNSRIASLENENRQLQQRIQQMETAADNAEQYSRRNCLRISGIQETDAENTDDLVLNLARSIDVELSLGDIDRSHRLGKPGNATGDTPRPRDTVVKFVSYRSRAKFYKCLPKTVDTKTLTNLPLNFYYYFLLRLAYLQVKRE